MKIFLPFWRKKPSSNGEVTHSEKGKQLAVLAPISFRLRVGVWLWIWPQHCRSCLLPPSAAQQTCSVFSLLMPCHFVQYSSFKHAQILFGLLASSQGFLVFCLSCSKSIGLLSFLPLFCFSTCFLYYFQHWFAWCWLTKALWSLHALVKHTTSFAYFLSFTTSSEVVIYDHVHETSFLFIGTDRYIWSVEEIVLHNVWENFTDEHLSSYLRLCLCHKTLVNPDWVKGILSEISAVLLL